MFSNNKLYQQGIWDGFLWALFAPDQEVEQWGIMGASRIALYLPPPVHVILLVMWQTMLSNGMSTHILHDGWRRLPCYCDSRWTNKPLEWNMHSLTSTDWPKGCSHTHTNVTTQGETKESCTSSPSQTAVGYSKVSLVQTKSERQVVCYSESQTKHTHTC